MPTGVRSEHHWDSCNRQLLGCGRTRIHDLGYHWQLHAVQSQPAAGYINYKKDGFVEDNLSADTVLAILFGISDKEKTERLLDNISALLETKNNALQQAGDFGVMSVYPFYRGFDRCYNRSSQEYEQQNGAAHPALSALVAYAELHNGRDHTYALTSSFDWNVKHGNYTPIDYYSPCAPGGAPLTAWNSVAALVYDWQDSDFFKENISVWK